MTITAKGQARRQALLDAVVRVLEREGPSGVTHRSVAAEAGVPLAAATYYFASIDELLVSALTRATEQQIALFTNLYEPTLTTFAQVLFDYAHTNRASAIAQYELLFLAMRRDSLRPAAELWYRCLEDIISAAEEPSGAERAVTAARPDDSGPRHPRDPPHNRPSNNRQSRNRVIALAIDGLVLRMLWRGDPATVEETADALREIIDS